MNQNENQQVPSADKTPYGTPTVHQDPNTRGRNSILQPSGLSATPVAENVIKYFRTQKLVNMPPDWTRADMNSITMPSSNRISDARHITISQSGTKYIASPQAHTDKTLLVPTLSTSISNASSSSLTGTTISSVKILDKKSIGSLEKDLLKLQSSQEHNTTLEVSTVGLPSVKLSHSEGPEQRESVIVLYRADDPAQTTMNQTLSINWKFYLFAFLCLVVLVTALYFSAPPFLSQQFSDEAKKKHLFE